MNALGIISFKLNKVREVLPEGHELLHSVNYLSWVIEKYDEKKQSQLLLGTSIISTFTFDMATVFGDVPKEGVGKQVIDAWLSVPSN